MNERFAAPDNIEFSAPTDLRNYSQADRPMAIWTSLGPDKLLLARLEIDESLSQPFEIRCELLSEHAQLDVSQLLRRSITVRLSTNGGPRYFHARVRDVKQLETDMRFSRYSLVAVPHIWFLSLKHDCRIFQNLSADEIVKRMLTEHAIPHRVVLHRRYKKRRYCVQYRESCLQFISRLLEEEGIFYYFEHTADGHTMVLSDQSKSASVINGLENIQFHSDHQHRPMENVVFQLERHCQAGFSRVTLTDFNFKKPSAFVKTDLYIPQVSEMYDFPGLFETQNEAEHTEKVQAEEYEAVIDAVNGKSTIRGLHIGSRTTLKDHFSQLLNREYFITGVHHSAVDNSYNGFDTNRDDFLYSNEFYGHPRELPYRPARVTPRPVVKGTQTAIVVGPKGQEIYTDSYGRVKVQFHWDRLGRRDADSSCWIRVSQPWAGSRWGAISIPRIGQEVIVDFLEGNPDRPIITGRVYNADQMPPYSLPAGQNMMGMRSKTVDGNGYNEIVIDDTPGAEMVRIHSQHNMLRQVLNDDVTNISNMQTETVGNCKLTTVAVDETTMVGNNKTASVAKAYKIDCDTFELNAKTSIKLKTGASTIKMNQAGVITISGNLITVTASVLSTITAPFTSVTGGILLTLNGALTNVISNVTNILAYSVARVKAGKIKLNC